MAGKLKQLFKKYSHARWLKPLAGFGRSINRFYENRNHDFYSNGELTLLKKLVTIQPKVVFDGGANTGQYCQQLALYFPQARIFAFEPVASTFQKLQNKVKDFDNITAVQSGLYSENKKQEINLFSSNTHSSLFDIQGLAYQPVGKEEIDLLEGDDFLEKQHIEKIDFLKLDLEGAEYDALVGFSKSLERKIIRMVQFEYGYINISTKNLLADYYRFFESYGYKVGKIFPREVEFRPYHFKYENFYGGNYVAVLEDDIELLEILKRKK